VVGRKRMTDWSPLEEIDREEKATVYTLIDKHYRKHYKYMVGLAYQAFQNRADAEEAVQDAYANACQYWDSVEVEHFDKWFMQILRNCIGHKWKDINANGMHVPYDHSLDLRVEEDISQLSRYQSARVKNAIAKHSLEVQKVLRLYVYRGYAAKAITAISTMNIIAVYSILRRFKEELKE